MKIRLLLAAVVTGSALAALPPPPKAGMMSRVRASGTVTRIDVAPEMDDTASAVVTTRGGHMAATQGDKTINALLIALVGATTVAYLKHAGSSGVAGSGASDSNYAAGLLYSGVALLGNTGVSAIRKILARHVGNAQQVRRPRPWVAPSCATSPRCPRARSKLAARGGCLPRRPR